MKKTALSLAFTALIALVLAGCSSSKNVPYFKNVDQVDLSKSEGLYDARIMPKDMLTITVSTTDPDAASPFNLTISGTVSITGNLSSSSNALQTYLVDNNGDINYPILGKVHVAGLTKNQCQDLLTEKIKPFLAKTETPIVTVKMSSFRVTVIGEVNKPCVIPVSTEKMSILEALAHAGDLSIYGKRDNVMLIRENSNGQKSIHRLNLNDAGLINSPYYYLQQNDVVYVEPNGVKAKNSAIGSSITIWFSLIGIVTSIASLVVNILR